MNARGEYLRESGYALAKSLMEIASAGILNKDVAEVLCQAAGYIVANEGMIEKIQEELYLIEERLCIQLDNEESGEPATSSVTPGGATPSPEGEGKWGSSGLFHGTKGDRADREGWFSDESPTPAP